MSAQSKHPQKKRPSVKGRRAEEDMQTEPLPLLEPAAHTAPRIGHRLITVLRWALLIALAVGCVAIFYVAVVMGETPELQRSADGVAVQSAYVPPAALPNGATTIESADLAQLEALFPARLAVLPRQEGFFLVSGRVEDVRVPGVGTTCRVVSLTYGHRSLRNEVVLHSATPGAYIQRFAQQPFLLDSEAVTMGSLPAITMTAQGRRYFMATQGEAVYILEGMAGDDLLPSVSAWVTRTGSETE